mgnify:CR=1 FL=1
MAMRTTSPSGAGSKDIVPPRLATVDVISVVPKPGFDLVTNALPPRSFQVSSI